MLFRAANKKLKFLAYQNDGAYFSIEFAEIIVERVIVSLTGIWRYVCDTYYNEWVRIIFQDESFA